MEATAAARGGGLAWEALPRPAHRESFDGVASEAAGRANKAQKVFGSRVVRDIGFDPAHPRCECLPCCCCGG